MLPAAMVDLPESLRNMPAGEMPALHECFARVAEDDGEPGQRRSFALAMRSAIDAMPAVDPVETLHLFDAVLKVN